MARTSGRGIVSFILASAMTYWAAINNFVTLAGSDYRWEVVEAGICSLLAIVFVVVGWSRMNRPSGGPLCRPAC